MPEIIYEDNHLLVAVKPPNLLTQGDATGDDCLLEQLKRYVKQKYQKPGEVYLGLVHRMDRPVGGLVAFARTSKAASRMSAQLRAHAMEREYLAVVEDGASLPDSGTLENWLLKDEAGGVRVTDAGAPGAQQARLHYRVLSRNGVTALAHIKLETGRKHQIRVQLMHSGHSIVYDMRYGHGQRGQNIALWGAVLRLTHPTKKEPMVFVSAPRGGAYAPYAAVIDGFLTQQQKGVTL
ncbi:MAG: RluA family pseudouridine synthase [Clostridiales bacterium]|nr:RluA family pseudouridine synthase [Clostridiales bacterium]